MYLPDGQSIPPARDAAALTALICRRSPAPAPLPASQVLARQSASEAAVAGDVKPVRRRSDRVLAQAAALAHEQPRPISNRGARKRYGIVLQDRDWSAGRQSVSSRISGRPLPKTSCPVKVIDVMPTSETKPKNDLLVLRRVLGGIQFDRIGARRPAARWWYPQCRCSGPGTWPRTRRSGRRIPSTRSTPFLIFTRATLSCSRAARLFGHAVEADAFTVPELLELRCSDIFVAFHSHAEVAQIQCRRGK